MIDVAEIKKEIEEKGYKKQYIASKLGLTPYGFSKKLNGLSEFKVSEIIALSDVLGFDDSKRNRIFFAQNDDFKSLHDATN